MFKGAGGVIGQGYRRTELAEPENPVGSLGRILDGEFVNGQAGFGVGGTFCPDNLAGRAAGGKGPYGQPSREDKMVTFHGVVYWFVLQKCKKMWVKTTE
jgi:hypothetical protein